MLWRVERGLISLQELGPAAEFLGQLREAEPYPAHVHPIHGDLRPQRIPACHYLESVPEPLALLHARCRGTLPDAEARECQFLYYPAGVQMHRHLDPDPRGDHWRVNVVVRRPARGGILLLDDEPVDLRPGDAYIFRADVVPHAVTPVVEGERVAWTSAFYA